MCLFTLTEVLPNCTNFLCENLWRYLSLKLQVNELMFCTYLMHLIKH